MTHGGDKDDAQFEASSDAEFEDMATDELDLNDDEPLPWLESSDYEEADDSVDTGRLVGFVILALLVLGLLIGMFWYFTNRGADPELAADGATIEAPAGDYKERPENPGGKEFSGTGDVAPAVGEGQVREGRLAEGANTAAETGAAAAAGEASDSGSARPSVDAPSSGAATGAAASGGTGVQIAALSSRAGAEQRWRELAGQTDALKGFKYRIEEARIDNGTVFRLQAVAGDRAAAKRLCDALQADGIQCLVK